MMRSLVIPTLTILLMGCTPRKPNLPMTSVTAGISIFEIYFNHPSSVDAFGAFLRDTLMLPVEWEPFDFFGDGVVYDAAYFLGNTTLELLALSDGDPGMDAASRFNRVLFQSMDIRQHNEYLESKRLQHSAPFDFNIVSGGSQLQIGRQINLDSLSSQSNVNIAFWQYEKAGYDFRERSMTAPTADKLAQELKASFESNPLGLIGLKDVHLTLEPEAADRWKQLLGETDVGGWKLANGTSIRYDLDTTNIGLDRIVLQVKDIDSARQFLSKCDIAFTEGDTGVIIDRTQVYGLHIILSE